ncbi:MAG TPA: alpha/beta family hydrolase [Chloroflexota bacterium]|jgi:predicted alpha/beta-hydrolase family hydrolase|nr:alpha/beta family hydrolase [Chloroflexota bacterium]
MDLILGHGASGNAASMRPWVDDLARHDIQAMSIDLPVGRAERAIETFRTACHAHPGAALGGHSFGGRVASMLAAEEPVPALVLLSYPLHRPGHPEDLRSEHWPRIACPVIALSGESDPFATIDLLRDSISLVPHAQLVTYPKVGHGLIPVIEDASTRIAAFLRQVATRRS